MWCFMFILHVGMLQLDEGITVFPEVGVYVTVNEATGQCHVSYELASDNNVSS